METIDGIVSCVRHSASMGENDYYIASLVDGAARLSELKSSVVLKVGDMVRNATISDGKIESTVIEDADSAINVIERVGEYAATLVREPENSGKKELDAVTANMNPKLREAAALLIEKLLLGAPIVIRFHNDADGATGAYGLYTTIAQLVNRISPSGSAKVFWKMQRSIAYSPSDSLEDMLTVGNYESIARPLLLITDFGTTQESIPGAEASSKKFDIVWIDHHPVVEEVAAIPKNYINPWMFGGDSNYTAGFLSCELGKRLADVDLSTIQSASLIGDYSGYAQDDAKGRDLALLLDMLTSDKRIAVPTGGNDITPSEIDQILTDEKRSTDLIKYAKTRLEDAVDTGISAMRMYKTSYANVYLLDFENVRKDTLTKYPLPGRYASKLLERIEKTSDKPPILVMHFGYFISMRVSAPVVDRANILGIASELRAQYPYIDSAGGHRSAASIKLKSEEMKKELMGALLRALGCQV
ncbi:MAG: hypothetical protein KGH49_02350 [Candidatus Micrarchaeota archaeon]|nr:hypothetical protein [Candidatus Micrarchaeota archaeon]